MGIGSQAPDVALNDVNGAAIELQDFRGHWVLLGFSSITCPVCKTMYPHLKIFSESRDDIQIVFISKGSTAENREMTRQQSFHFPVLTLGETDIQILQDYEVPGTPFFYMIDEKGIIQNVGFANTEEQLRQLVEGTINR